MSRWVPADVHSADVMAPLKESAKEFVWRRHREQYPLVVFFGHMEMLEGWTSEYLEWLATDEARPFLDADEREERDGA